jgi:uncharacterized protein YndB with AHSA1/START domain
MRLFLATAAAGLMLGGAASAAPMAEFPAVDETSYVEANGDRAIQLTVQIPAAPDKVWRLLSTSEGWKSFATAEAWVDFRVGGMIETAYKPGAVHGQAGNIKNEIVAHVPGRLLVIRNVQAPPGFANAEAFSRTLTVIELRPAGPDATAVTLSAIGFGKGPAFDDLYGKFRMGDAWTLDSLRKVLTGETK